MAEQQHAPGGHYSGQNKIPTVNQLLERLDGNKKERDREIDEQKQANVDATEQISLSPADHSLNSVFAMQSSRPIREQRYQELSRDYGPTPEDPMQHLLPPPLQSRRKPLGPLSSMDYVA